MTGTQVWARRYGGTGNESVLAVATNSNRNVLATGWFAGAVTAAGS